MMSEDGDKSFYSHLEINLGQRKTQYVINFLWQLEKGMQMTP